MKHLSIRNLPPGLSIALEQEKLRRGGSLNQTVIDLLSQSLGIGPGQNRDNGLGSLAGTWTEQDFKEFEQAVAIFEAVDPDMWQ